MPPVVVVVEVSPGLHNDSAEERSRYNNTPMKPVHFRRYVVWWNSHHARTGERDSIFGKTSYRVFIDA